MSSDSQIDLLNKLKEEFIKVTDNLRDQQTRGPPSSNERSTKRRKRDRDQEEAEGRSDLSATEGSEDLNKSVAPSRCSSETRGNILEFTAAGLAQLRVPKERFDEIITLEPEFPPELPGLVYDDLAKQLRFHKCIEDMNEMTRQTIVHSLLVTICSFINSKHPEKSAPVIELNKSLIWFYKEKRLDNKSRKINGKIDISMVDGSDEKLYYLVIEMNAINCYEGAKHGLIHLKRIRELNKKDKIVYGLSCTLERWNLFSLEEGNMYKISNDYRLVPFGETLDEDFKSVWIEKYSLFVKVLYTLIVRQMR